MLLAINLILLIVPGTYAYISGRKFLSMERTKEFALKYFKYQQRSAFVFWICFFVALMVINFQDHNHFMYALIKEYTWGIGYLIFFVVAYSLFITGFSKINGIIRDEHVPLWNRIKFNCLHLYLMLWPYVFLGFAAFSSHEGVIAHSIILLFVYAIMYYFSFDFWRILMRAYPLPDNKLAKQCASVIEHAGIKTLPLYIFPAENLKFANAFFIGNLGTKQGVFISKFARDNLSSDELLATYAHEAGHGQKHQVIQRSIALTIPFLLLLGFNITLHDPHIIAQIASLVVAFIIMKLLIPSQRFEKEADLFALKATGDAEKVISGLEKIYNLGILPERFAPSEEKRLSHPSLVKRKNYIRYADGLEVPTLSEPIVFTCSESENKVIFESGRITITNKNKEDSTYPYREITSMYPKTIKKNNTELMIRFMNNKQRILLAAPYDEVAAAIDRISYKFSNRPYVDPSRFKRTYYIWTGITTFFGLAFTFIIGPALLILGITGLARRRKTMLLSIGFANILYFLYPHISPHHASETLGKEYSIVFGLIGVICLFDYIGIRRFKESEDGKGSVSFGFSIFFTMISLGTLLALGVSLIGGTDPFAVHGTYNVLFYNSVVCAIGFLFSFQPGQIKRVIFLGINSIMFLIFVLLNL